MSMRCIMYIHDIRSGDVTQKLKNMMPTINPSQNCLSWHLSFTTMANDNKLDEEQQLGVIAAHKSKSRQVVAPHPICCHLPWL